MTANDDIIRDLVQILHSLDTANERMAAIKIVEAIELLHDGDEPLHLSLDPEAHNEN